MTLYSYKNTYSHVLHATKVYPVKLGTLLVHFLVIANYEMVEIIMVSVSSIIHCWPLMFPILTKIAILMHVSIVSMFLVKFILVSISVQNTDKSVFLEDL